MSKPWLNNPVAHVQFVPLDKVSANDYNPNAVAPNEMRLLYTSIKADGYTQPVVVVRDEEQDRYVIVDGFHRYSIMKAYQDIYDANAGMLPVVVIDKDMNERMAATVRHNRARGKHSVAGMAEMVFAMLTDETYDDARICNELGLSAEELIRYKHVTGFSRLFEDGQFGMAWRTARQAKLERDWKKEHASG
jgi:ParB-like chromosome segregation protein Spo0J